MIHGRGGILIPARTTLTNSIHCNRNLTFLAWNSLISNICIFSLLKFFSGWSLLPLAARIWPGCFPSGKQHWCIFIFICVFILAEFLKGLNDFDCIVCHTIRYDWGVQCTWNMFQLHKGSALWDMKNILVIDRERRGTLVMYVLQNVGRRNARTVRTLRLCALNGARARPPTDRAPVRAHRALRAPKWATIEIHFCGTQPCYFKRCS